MEDFMKKTFFVLCLLILTSVLFANSDNFSITADFAYYPKSTPVTNSENAWFAPIKGIYSSVECRVIGKYNYIISTPFGTNPLVSGNNLNLGLALELTPVTITPEVSLCFTPVAFLKFTTSGRIGTGWNFIGNMGIGKLDSPKNGYVSVPSFQNWYYEFKFSSLFQFDLGVVISGDWTHVVTLASYDVIYNGQTSAKEGEPWYWQAGGEYFNGWKYYSNIIVGYQMPLVLQTVGVQFEFSGYFDGVKVNAPYKDWNPYFTKIAINPVMILEFTENQALTIQFNFSSRRGFAVEKGDSKTYLDFDYVGREWYVNRIAFSYTIKL